MKNIYATYIMIIQIIRFKINDANELAGIKDNSFHITIPKIINIIDFYKST